MASIKEIQTGVSPTSAIFRRIFPGRDEAHAGNERVAAGVVDGGGVAEGVAERLAEAGNGKVSTTIGITSAEDIVTARQNGRSLVHRIGFSDNQATIVATAISELARNMLLYAKSGEITITDKIDGYRVGVVVEAVDGGPGIANIRNAMKSGYSTSGGLGFGLSGVRDMVDEFVIRSHEGKGTSVMVTVWLR